MLLRIRIQNFLSFQKKSDKRYHNDIGGCQKRIFGGCGILQTHNLQCKAGK